MNLNTAVNRELILKTIDDVIAEVDQMIADDDISESQYDETLLNALADFQEQKQSEIVKAIHMYGSLDAALFYVTTDITTEG